MKRGTRAVTKEWLLEQVWGFSTYLEIAQITGLSRRYVQHLVADDGLKPLMDHNRAWLVQERRAAKKNATFARMGCSYAEYKALPDDVKRGFQAHRSNARHRGVPWQFNLYEWWTVWAESGHWERRGRGAGQYVMARHGDQGAYAPGNVAIITGDENKRFACSYRKRSSDGRLTLTSAPT